MANGEHNFRNRTTGDTLFVASHRTRINGNGSVVYLDGDGDPLEDEKGLPFEYIKTAGEAPTRLNIGKSVNDSRAAVQSMLAKRSKEHSDSTLTDKVKRDRFHEEIFIKDE